MKHASTKSGEFSCGRFLTNEQLLLVPSAVAASAFTGQREFLVVLPGLKPA